MDNSILYSIKTMLGVSPDDTAFDMEIIVHINSIIFVLRQLGVSGTADSVDYISGPKTKWTDVFPNIKRLELIKTYIYLKVRLLFDPPSSSTTASAFEVMASEYEWRINLEVENGSLLSASSDTTSTATYAVYKEGDKYYFDIDSNDVISGNKFYVYSETAGIYIGNEIVNSTKKATLYKDDDGYYIEA